MKSIKCNICNSNDHETILCPIMGDKDYLAESIDRIAGDREAMREIIRNLRGDFRMNVILRRELESRVELLEKLTQESISTNLRQSPNYSAENRIE